MKAYDEEFEKAMDNFEKSVKMYAYTSSFEKEDASKVPVGCWYCNGKTNELFKVYLLGYEYGKYTERV